MSTVVQSVPPLFIKDSDIGVPTLAPFDMCTAAIRATNASSLEGVQKINGLWRLYFKDKATRLQLCISQRITLLYGVDEFDFTENEKIINETLKFIHETKRFE